MRIERLPLIPYGRQSISDDDIAAVVDALRSDFLTQGPQVPAFEQRVADYCRVPHAIAVNSATSALHIACLALGVGPGDCVWTSPNTFVASANCARYCGASIDFVDIDPRTFNLCADALEAKLESAEQCGTLPKVVIPVHFAGLPSDMERIHALSKRYGFHIIEDAAHAIGAKYSNGVVGDCRYSDITVFSFHPVKIITTAEGGLATTRSLHLERQMRLLRSHGITRDADEFKYSSEGSWYYEQQCLGFNYRMTELQAALGISQLKHLDEWVSRRHHLANTYDKELSQLPIIVPVRPAESKSASHLYVIQIDASRTELRRATVFERLREAEIGVNVHYIPVHLQPYFRALGFKSGQFPVCEGYYSRCISLPMFSGLTDAEQKRVVQAIKDVFS